MSENVFESQSHLNQFEQSEGFGSSPLALRGLNAQDTGGATMPPPSLGLGLEFSQAPVQRHAESPPTLLDRLQEQRGLVRTNRSAMVEIVLTSDGEALNAARTDPQVRQFLEANLNASQMLEVAKVLYPEDLFSYYVRFLEFESARWRTDLSAIVSLLMELSPRDRLRMFEQHRHLFRCLRGYRDRNDEVDPDSNFGRVMRLCLGSEAEGLQASMELATSGLGTRDDLLEEIVSRTGNLAGEEQRLEAELASGSVSPERILEIEARLNELGSVRENLLVTNGENPVAGSFLSLMEVDLGRNDYERLIGQLGMEDYDRARLIILDSIGVTNDEEAVYRAIESIPDAVTRNRLLNDPEIEAALDGNFNRRELRTVEGFGQEDNALFVARHKLENTQGWLSRDWSELFDILQDLTDEQRAELLTAYRYLLRRVRQQANPLQNQALDQIFEQGRIDPATAIELGTQGWNDMDIITSAFRRLPNTERFQFRVGYAIERGMTIPEVMMSSSDQDFARQAFLRLQEEMTSGLGEAERRNAIDALIGSITVEEYEMEGGNELIAFILNEQVDDRQETDFGWDVSRLYSEAGGTAEVAGESFDDFYARAMEDGEISDEERMQLMYLESNYQERFDEHVDAANLASEIASTVAAVAVGLLATVVTGGAAGPFIAAALAGAAFVGSRELTAGDNYEMTGEDGLRDGLLALADVATAGVTGRLASRLVGSLARSRALAGRPLAQALAREAGEAATEAATERGIRVVAAGISGAAEEAIAGAVGEIAAALLDENTYNQSLQDSFTRLGESILRGTGTGIVTGGTIGAVGSLLGNGTSGVNGDAVPQSGEGLDGDLPRNVDPLPERQLDSPNEVTPEIESDAVATDIREGAIPGGDSSESVPGVAEELALEVEGAEIDPGASELDEGERALEIDPETSTGDVATGPRNVASQLPDHELTGAELAVRYNCPELPGPDYLWFRDPRTNLPQVRRAPNSTELLLYYDHATRSFSAFHRKALTRRNFRHNLMFLTQRNPGRNVHAHHVFPVELEAQFESAGIDIHDPRFGAWWEAGPHIDNAAAYNEQWRNFFAMHTNPEPNREQILDEGREIMALFGLSTNF